MKLLKKLLPLGIVATTAAAVVPMAVSCGKQAGISDFDYLPSVEQHEAKVFEYEAIPIEANLAATEEYAANVNENPEILIEDWYWGVSHTEKIRKISDEQYCINVKYNFNIEIKNVSLAKTTVSGDQYYFLSFDYELNRHEEYDNIHYENSQKIVEHTQYVRNWVRHFSNIPILATYQYEDGWEITLDERLDGGDDLVAISPNFEYISDEKDDSVYSTTVGSNTHTEKHHESNIYKYNKDNVGYYALEYDITFHSYYLGNCAIKQKQ